MTMAENSKIEWCDHTFNPWIGCTRVSAGCDGCYAAVSTPARAMGVKWGAGEERHRTAPRTWAQPKRWNDRHAEFFAAHGRRQRVFCASLADVFDNEVPVEWRVDLFRLIAATPNLDWLLLTKRIGNAWPMMLEISKRCQGGEQPLDNMWLGATVVNQEEADRDIPKLLATPARVRFLSIEPMLGPVDLDSIPWGGRRCSALRGWAGPELGIHWVIVGGESGHGARPLHVEWVRSIVRQCQAARVPALVKQLGATVLDVGMSSPGGHWPSGMVREPIPRSTESDAPFVVRLKHKKGGDVAEWPEDLRVREFPNA